MGRVSVGRVGVGRVGVRRVGVGRMRVMGVGLAVGFPKKWERSAVMPSQLKVLTVIIGAISASIGSKCGYVNSTPGTVSP